MGMGWKSCSNFIDMKKIHEYDLYGFEKYKKQHRNHLFGSNFDVFTHDKCLIFSGPKLCSSLIKKANGEELFRITIDEIDILDISNNNQNHPLQDKIIEDFENIKLDKIKKDIIILYREPFRRFISGFSQDYVRGMLQTQIIDQINSSNYGILNPLISQWFDDKNISTIDRIDILKWAAYPDTDDFSEKFNKHHLELRNEIIKSIVNRSIFEGNLNSNHHKPLFNSIVRFLESIKNCKSKVKLVNIDEVDVGKFLAKYDDIYKDIGYVNKNSKLSDLVRDEILNKIKKEQDSKLYTKINWLLYYEYEYYFKMINTYSNLIFKENE